MLAIADAVAHLVPNLFSLEMWGGATFDTAMRFLQEDPWDRLDRAAPSASPTSCFRCCCAAATPWATPTIPTTSSSEFIRRSAAAGGIDVFRIFDSLNWTENMKVAIEAVRDKTVDLRSGHLLHRRHPRPARTKYDLKYYVKMAKELEKMGTHILAIKDMAGLCKPYAAYTLVKALRDEVGVPIHFHTHDTSGINAASVLRAADAGVDIADAALASMSGMTSQPNLNSLVAALRSTRRATPASISKRSDEFSDYWEAVRELYYPFEEGMKAPAPDVYLHEMPGGQFTNLKQQAKSLGLEHRWREVAEAYAEVNQLFGDIVKVTPSSKVVGDMALFMVANGLTADDVLPEPAAQLPAQRRRDDAGHAGRARRRMAQEVSGGCAGIGATTAIKGRPGAKMPKVDFKAARTAGAGRKSSDRSTDRKVLSRTCSIRRCSWNSRTPPAVRRHVGHSHAQFLLRRAAGRESRVDIEPGKTLIIKSPDRRGA